MTDSRIPLFDSLTHPTLNGDWILPRYPGTARLPDLEAGMESAGIRAAFAVGMIGIGGYEEAGYFDLVRRSRCTLLPVAYCDYQAIRRGDLDLCSWLDGLVRRGYRGVKVHIRFSEIPLRDPLLAEILAASADRGLAPLLCTYRYGAPVQGAVNRLDDFMLLLDRVGPRPVVLLHGGDVNVLHMMEIVRAFPHAILDLALTLCKYEGSSVDDDIRFLFQKFDRRVCVGSDHPEFSSADLRRRFDEFASQTTAEKAWNIGWRNLARLVGLPDPESRAGAPSEDAA